MLLKYRKFGLLAGCLTVLSVPLQAQQPPTDERRQEIETARSKVYPALVNISVVARFFTGGRAQRAPAGGSGVIVSSDGYVLTNFHVAGNTTRIACTLTTGEVIDAKVVLHDPLTDLSVLKLLVERRADPKTPLAFAALADSDKAQIGDAVMAMGNPLMLSSSMTLGIISNTKRVFTDFTSTQIEEQELEPGEKTGIFTRWLQHDALILPGNSGGPLVNGKGEVVGINELGGNGVGFAIPSNIAAQVLKGAMEKGEMTRAWLGVSVMPVAKTGRTTGTLVASVIADSPAGRAGLQAGDILLKINGQETNARFFEEVPLFYQKVAALPVGQSATIQYVRKNEERSATVTVAAMERSLGREEELRQMGASVQEITSSMLRSRRLPTREGVYLTGVRAGYPFEGAQPPLSGGDVITKVGNSPTASLEALRTALAKANKKEFAVTIRRRNEEILSIVKVPEEAAESEGTDLPKAWFGVRTQVVTTAVAKALGVPSAKGFRITEVYPDTAIRKAGLQVGDIVVGINKDTLTSSRPQDAEDLRRLTEDLPIGKPAEIRILRAGKPQKLTFVVEAQPIGSETAKKARQKELEFSVRDLTPLDRVERRLQRDQKGILVTEATSGGWANIAGLQLDDVILAINGNITDDVDTFNRAMKTVLQEHPKVVQLFVRRGDKTNFVFIEPDWSKLAETE